MLEVLFNVTEVTTNYNSAIIIRLLTSNAMNGVFTSYALEDATKNQKRSFGDVIQTFENKSVNSLSQPKRE